MIHTIKHRLDENREIELLRRTENGKVQWQIRGTTKGVTGRLFLSDEAMNAVVAMFAEFDSRAVHLVATAAPKAAPQQAEWVLVP